MSAPGYAHRLRQARERSGKSIAEMAAVVGTSWESYNHLEEDDEEIIDSVSLRQLVKLSEALNLDLVDFFSNTAPKPARSVSLDALAEKIKEYLVAHKIGVDEFEDLVGWEIEHCLSDPSRFLDFNLLGLMEVCDPLAVNWLSILADLPAANEE